MLLKCCSQYVSKFGKLGTGHRTGKGSVFIPIPKKGNVKECSNYHTIALISYDNNIILKIFQVGFSSTLTKNVQMYKLGLEKAEESEIKLLTFAGS